MHDAHTEFQLPGGEPPALQTVHGMAGRPAKPATSATGRVLVLTDPVAADPAVAGAKAANLARAAAGGIPVLDGVVLSTEGPPDREGLRRVWETVSAAGTRPLVVRSSSTVEDAGASSMAGQFRSVLGVDDWGSFRRAVDEVYGSSARFSKPGTPAAPMAVLVQPELRPRCGGVMFGVDPITGDPRRLMIEAVEGGPHVLVDGSVTAARSVVTRRGRVVEGSGGPVLNRREHRQLADLARQAERVFGGPQDVEWAFDGDGRLWLLQSRPITARGDRAAAQGPLLGPGPVSETFPYPLRQLEIDLWVAPLRQGIREALTLTAGVSHRRITSSPVVTTVGGHVAVDLELLGVAEGRTLVRRIDPRRGARRLIAAWRVGRVRAALSDAAAEVVRQADRDLAAIPAIRSLADDDLLNILDRSGQELAALHVREVLCGMLLTGRKAGPTAASIALDALAAGRAERLSDDAIVDRTPIVLALSGPRIGTPPVLPSTPPGTAASGRIGELSAREGLRLRARWVQELTGRVATELGGRLADAGQLPERALVANLTMPELRALVAGTTTSAPPDVARRGAEPPGPPLPARFRLTPDGTIVAALDAAGPVGGRAAGGGRGMGTVFHDVGARHEGVLVVETLSPELAPELPRLSGLVSETGSTLAHLAILAREYAVPTVVGVPQARRRFPVGSTVVVDGGTGEVSIVPRAEGEQS